MHSIDDKTIHLCHYLRCDNLDRFSKEAKISSFLKFQEILTVFILQKARMPSSANSRP